MLAFVQVSAERVASNSWLVDHNMVFIEFPMKHSCEVKKLMIPGL